MAWPLLAPRCFDPAALLVPPSTRDDLPRKRLRQQTGQRGKPHRTHAVAHYNLLLTSLRGSKCRYEKPGGRGGGLYGL
eukprot:scaffold480026_cov52-Prasinocladus_malaysianus.AAC.1